ncbi:MAG: PEGA domain-containing protein [Myxococcaceae bacterium]|nr:PEGA domain-containing protein [Myxococcaceae bacterium]
MKAAPLLLILVSLPVFAAGAAEKTGPEKTTGEKTLWLVRPLYPGQEALAGRTEQALDKLTPAALRPNQVIGRAELVAALKGKKAEDLPCFLGETRCADPIDPFVAGLGFERVVLIQGGQDEGGFKFKVVSYEPHTGKTMAASATDTNLDNALLGAVAKVVSVAAVLDVTTSPPGVTVFVDDRKVGVTPLSTQVLPGERVVRLDLKLHQGIEETVIVPMRGAVKLDKTLEKVAARIVITALPAGTSISVDGQVLGKDRVDRGIQPGIHTIRLTAENHKAFEQTVQVKADDQLILDKTLEPIAGAVPPKEIIVIQKPPPPPVQPPPPPLSLTEQLEARRSYFYVGFEYDRYQGGGLVSHRFGDEGNARSSYIESGNRELIGATFEFGYLGKYFGLAAIGGSVMFLDRSWTMTIGRVANKTLTGSAANCPTGEDTFDDTSMMNVCHPTQIQAKLMVLNLRVIQPAFRIQVWRFMFMLQAGFEVRIGHLTQQTTDTMPTVSYNDGFMVMDLGVSGRVGFRFYIVDGLFVYANYKLAGWFVSPFDPDGALNPDGGSKQKTSPLNQGFSGGLGYAF